MQSTLEFDLRMQEYIELARQRKHIEAIAYSKKYLTPWQETHLLHIRQVSALLAYGPDTKAEKYRVRLCSLPALRDIFPAPLSTSPND